MTLSVIIDMTQPEVKEFWQGNDYLAIKEANITKALKGEGLQGINDFLEFADKDLKACFENLLKYGMDVTTGTGAQRVTTKVNVRIPAKTQKRILVACRIVHYYAKLGREIKADMLLWKVLKDFDEQWEALEEKAKADEPSVPKLTKGMPVWKFLEPSRSTVGRLLAFVGHRCSTCCAMSLICRTRRCQISFLTSPTLCSTPRSKGS
jgi:hypothetical protein